MNAALSLVDLAPCLHCSAIAVPLTRRDTERCQSCDERNCVACAELWLDGEVGIHAMCGYCLSEYDDSRRADGGAL